MLDLSAAKVTTLDQFGKAFTPEELAAYPASVRWTLEKNDTHAVISGNTLSFGDQDGTMTLICAAVNADTNVIVEKKIIIRITDSTSGGGSFGGGSFGGAVPARSGSTRTNDNNQVKTTDKRMKKWIWIAVVVIVAIFIFSSYNGFVSKEEAVNTA